MSITNEKTRTLEQWYNLPDDMLRLISDRIDDRLDLSRIRAVCRSWRSSIPPMKKKNKFTLSIRPMFDFHNRIKNKIVLEEGTLYRLKDMDSNSWFVKVVESKPRKFSILNPFPSQQKLYSPENITVFPKELNLLDCHVFEMGKTYKVRVGCKNHGWKKVVYSANHSKVLAICKYNRLEFIRLHDLKWTSLLGFQTYTDIMYYRDKFYAVGEHGNVAVIDSVTMDIITLGTDLLNTSPMKGYLMESCGEIYVVDACVKDRKCIYFDNYYYMSQSAKFKIYRLNESDGTLVEVRMRDHVVFVSDDYSFMASTEELVGFFGNCIYFTGDLNLFFRNGRYRDVVREILLRHDMDYSVCNIHKIKK